MATRTKGDKSATVDTVEDGVRGFSMALREALMDYYKGTCIQGFGSLSQYSIGQSRVPLPSDGSRRDFNYEREEHRRRDPIGYYLEGDKMFEVWRNDHEIIFHPSVMRRSEELSVAYDQVREFFEKFLPGVKVIERDDPKHKPNTDGSNDRKYIFRAITDQYKGRPDEDDDEDDEYDEDF